MNLRSTVLAASSGLLLVVIFPTINFHLLAWIALVPLFWAISGKTVKEGFWLGGITGILYFAGTVHWITNSVHYYGGVPLIPASLITLLLCAYLSLYPALFGAAVVHLRERHPSLLILSAPAVWTALELARTHIFSGFPWSLLGYSQYLVLPVIQVSDITGVYGVSFLIVLVNAAVAQLLQDRKKYPVLVAAAVMVLVVGYGFMRLRTAQSTGGITVSVVQGNIEQDMKWDPVYQTEVLGVYTRLTQEALQQHPDIVIWPETAIPFYFNGEGPRDRALREDLTAFVKKNGVPLLFGSPTYEAKPGRVVYLRNSAFLLAADGTVGAVYHKIHLVPFGEYVPLKRVLFFVEKMVQAIGDFESGNDYTVMTIAPHGPGGSGEVKLSTAICYEIIFPDLIRRFVDRGAGIITTITNDAWFGRTAAPYQHFSMGVFRAVENRVPVARAANTGISGFIDANGRILDTSAVFTTAHLTHRIFPGSTKTIYTRYGDVFSYLCLFASVVLLAGLPRRLP